MTVQKFRVYPGEKNGRGLYVEVRVFSSRREMLQTLRAELRAIGIRRRITNTALAFTMSQTRRRYAKNGRGRTSPCFAQISFWRKRLGTWVITHEFFHAVMAYGQRLKMLELVPARREWSEETLAYAHCYMCSRFVDRATKLGLYQ